MNWTILRRVLIVGGVLYAVALVPSSIRPSWSAAPFRKPDQTMNVDAVTSRGALPADFSARMRRTCRAAAPLRPIVGSAKHVRVVVLWAGKPITIRQETCARYTA